MKQEEKSMEQQAATPPESPASAEAIPEPPAEEAQPTVIEQQAAEILDLERRLLRLHADFDNYRKRTMRDREDQAVQAEAELLKTMLPVLDNFARALSVLPAEEAWAEGVRLVERQWMQVLTTAGLSVIDCQQAFDPNVHEAVMRDESGEHPEGTILQELQRGYQYKGKLLRPSMVKVAVGRGGGQA